MTTRLILTANAYFYKRIKPISKNLISKTLISAAINKQGKYIYKIIRNKLSTNGSNFEISLVIFKQETLPGFLVPGPERELKYGYLLLVEFGQYFVVSKRGTAEFLSIIEKKIAELEYFEISGFKISPSTQFTKIGVTSLDTSQASLKRATYEATDVKEVLSNLSTGHKIVTGLKLKNLGRNSTIAPSTSRINDLGQRINLDFFCTWAADQCNNLNRYTKTVNYLDSFAEPLEYKTNIKNLNPTSILFNFSSLLDGLEDNSIAGIYFLNNNQQQRNINLDIISSTHDLCMDIDYKKKSKNYPIINSIDNTLQLKILKNGLGIYSEKLNRIFIQYTNGGSDNLLQLINRDSLFIVSFNKAEIRYALKTLFRNSNLLGNIPHFLKAFESHATLNASTSEKGKCISTSNSFDPGCLFEIIESHHSADCDFLLCDDLGDEWADFIGFRNTDFIRFYHAKHSIKNFSGSAFHDIVAQALKNIGNLNFNQNLNTKQSKISSYYSNTAIPRLRKGTNISTCFQHLRETHNYPNSTKEIYLVINFLSIAELTNQLQLLTLGKAKSQTIQILWLLSSLIGECMEKGIKIKILTKP